MQLATCTSLALSLLFSSLLILTSTAQPITTPSGFRNPFRKYLDSVKCSKRAISDAQPDAVASAIYQECEYAVNLMLRPVLDALEEPLHIYNPIVGEARDEAGAPREWTYGRCRIALSQPALHPSELEEAKIDHLNVTGGALRAAALKVTQECVTGKKRLGGRIRLQLLSWKKGRTITAKLRVMVGVSENPNRRLPTTPPPVNLSADNEYSRDMTCLGKQQSDTGRTSRADCITALTQLTEKLGSNSSASVAENRPQLMLTHYDDGRVSYQALADQKTTGKCTAQFWTDTVYAIEGPLSAPITLNGILSLAAELVDTCLVGNRQLGGSRTIRIDNQPDPRRRKGHLRLHVQVYVQPDYLDPDFQELLAVVAVAPDRWDVDALSDATRHLTFEPERPDQHFTNVN